MAIGYHKRTSRWIRCDRSPFLIGLALPLTLSLLSLEFEVPGADCTSVTITNQPRSWVAFEGCPVTFEVGATGTEPLFYQWFNQGQPIPDATNSSYTVPRATPQLDGHTFHAVVSNSCSTATSDAAELTISLDVFQPILLRLSGDATLHKVILTFGFGGCYGLTSKSVEQLFNYTLHGEITLVDAELDATGTKVILTTTEQFPGDIYSVDVAGLCDEVGECMNPTTREFQAWVRLPGSDEPVPPPVSIDRFGDQIVVSWPPGSLLQTSADLTGPWIDCYYFEPGPLTLNATNAARFYRAAF